MTLVAFVVFALSHAALIVLFEKQRKKIDRLQAQNLRLWRQIGKYEKIVQQQEAELRMLAKNLRK